MLPGGMPLSVFIIEYTNFKRFMDNVEVLSWFFDSPHSRNSGQLRELAFISWLSFNIFIMTIVSYIPDCVIYSGTHNEVHKHVC